MLKTYRAVMVQYCIILGWLGILRYNKAFVIKERWHCFTMTYMQKKRTGRLITACVAFFVCVAMVLPQSAYAAVPTYNDDILLGVFTNSDKDSSDVLYASTTGTSFTQISTAYVNSDPNDPSNYIATPKDDLYRWYDIYCHSCPSIIYYNGYYWMLSNEASNQDQTVYLAVSFSKDLEHWSDPRRGVCEVSGKPLGRDTYDAVAADWSVGPDGCVYVSVSMGYFGAFHGEPENDTMTPYIIKIDNLSTTGDPTLDARDNAYTITCNGAAPVAKQAVLPLVDSDRIDGSFYFEGYMAYYIVKRHGVYNEIYATKFSNFEKQYYGQFSGPLGGGSILTGYEAPSMVIY